MSILSTKQLTKQYGTEPNIVKALDGVSISIEPGEFVAIIGPSGSGKSTFLTIAGGLQIPSSGEVLVGGQPYSNLSEKERAKLRFRDIGFILQNSKLIPYLTVEQQLDLVDKIGKSSDREWRDQLLSELNVDHLRQKLPSTISGGERQRVAIARALYHNPSLILADEPTASLDTNRAYEVVALLAKEAKKYKKAIVMVTHDIRMVKDCDAVYKMKDGVLTKED